MHQQTLTAIVAECAEQLQGRFLGKIFQLSEFNLVMDFGARDAGYLLITADPRSPRLHLVQRRARDLEKTSSPHGPFAQALRSSLTGAELQSLGVLENERVATLRFLKRDDTGAVQHSTLLAQLTGRSANLLLLDQNDRITHALRPPRGAGQSIGEVYQPPPRQAGTSTTEAIIERGDFPSLSAAVDDYFSRREREEHFRTRVQSLRDQVRREIAQKEKLRSNLNQDLRHHGDPEQHKQLGDLLLANIASATRDGQTVRLRNYYAEGAPEIEIEVDENKSLKDEAARYFARYAKAKRAREEIAGRLESIEKEWAQLQLKQTKLEEVAASNDEARLDELAGAKIAPPQAKKKAAGEKLPGVRRYRSSDGYEVLVGRAAQTNDRLTFKVARPHDLWLHAANYPGSHVIVRNSSRKEIPQRTIFEAAALAAKFSQAGDDAKVDVHYAERKFLSKPKGAAPGLVRMSIFKTVTVAPGETIERLTN